MEKHSNQISDVYELLKQEYVKHRMPVVELIEIQTRDPFKVLIATILSARTKDNVTSQAAQRLFTKVKTIGDIDKIDVEELQQLIFPVGFFREKARNLKELPMVLREKFNGKIPSTVEELVELPGVGRKTANLVVAVAFNKPAVCVDIHVHRIFNRLGYLKSSSPLETEMELRDSLPQKYWTTFNSYFVSFGQHICNPVNPHCDECPIYRFCSRVGVTTKYERTVPQRSSKRSRTSASRKDAPER